MVAVRYPAADRWPAPPGSSALFSLSWCGRAERIMVPRIRAESIEEHKALTRRQILGAAQELFRTYGYLDTSLGDVAAHVGVGRTTLYEYFADKEDLVCSLVEETLPEVIAEMIAGVPAELSPTERLAELALRMVGFVATDPSLGTILHEDVPKLSPRARFRVREAHGDFAAEFMRIYREGVAAGELRSLPPDLAGRFLQDVIMSAAGSLIALDDPKQRLPEVADSMVDFMLHGLSLD